MNNILIFVAVLFAIPCGVALFRLDFGLYVYLVIIPFAYFLKRLMFLYPPVTQTDWTFASALPDFVLGCIFLHLLVRRGPKIYRSSNTLPVFLFLVWCCIEILNPKIDILIGLAGFKKTALYISMYFIGAAIARDDKKAISRIGKVAVACAIPVAMYGAYQFFFGLASFEIDVVNSGLTAMGGESISTLYAQGFVRAFSTFSGPWILGDYLAIAIMFNLLAYLAGERRKIAFLAIACVLCFGLFVTLSRSSYLMLFVSLAILYVVQSGTKRSFRWRLAVSVITVSLALLASAFVASYPG